MNEIELWEQEIATKEHSVAYLQTQLQEAIDRSQEFINAVDFLTESTGVVLEISIPDIKKKIHDLWEKFKKWVGEMKKKLNGIVNTIKTKLKEGLKKLSNIKGKAKKVDEAKKKSSKNESYDFFTEADNEGQLNDGRYSKVKTYRFGLVNDTKPYGNVLRANFDSAFDKALEMINVLSKFKNIDTSNIEKLKALLVDTYHVNNYDTENVYFKDLEKFTFESQPTVVGLTRVERIENLQTIVSKMQNDLIFFESLNRDIDQEEKRAEKLDIGDNADPEVIKIYAKVSQMQITNLKKLRSIITKNIMTVTKHLEGVSKAMMAESVAIEKEYAKLMSE